MWESAMSILLRFRRMLLPLCRIRPIRPDCYAEVVVELVDVEVEDDVLVDVDVDVDVLDEVDDVVVVLVDVDVDEEVDDVVVHVPAFGNSGENSAI